ncbi:acyltransferase family protein [Neobacillus niacini]|uniref:acyltransferase family protein n=1 Tax=Neobacillus niacini TaxID=86668 RepID=UPI003983180D
MKRQYDLDWIRVIATLAVFIYHCFMFFNPWAWHVKNNETDPTYITALSLFMSGWLMPSFFVVSGINSYYTLQKRSGRQYIKERVSRLGVPLLFGIMILTPPQIYMERVSHGQYSGSFFSWYPHYFDGVYLGIGGPGNFAFVGLHLWYLLVLLIFSLITLPFFLKIKPNISRELTPFHLFVLSIPLIIITILIDVVNLGGWDISFYLAIFLYGYIFFTKSTFKSVVQRLLPATMTISILTTVFFVFGFMTGMPSDNGGLSILLACVKAINCWSWLLVIFALADKKLSNPNKWLNYGSKVSMPFYVIHQPIIVTLGFLISDWEWSISVKLIFLLVTAFIMIIVFYHYIISRFSFIQILFGMKGSTGKISEIKEN